MHNLHTVTASRPREGFLGLGSFRADLSMHVRAAAQSIRAGYVHEAQQLGRYLFTHCSQELSSLFNKIKHYLPIPNERPLTTSIASTPIPPPAAPLAGLALLEAQLAKATPLTTPELPPAAPPSFPLSMLKKVTSDTDPQVDLDLIPTLSRSHVDDITAFERLFSYFQGYFTRHQPTKQIQADTKNLFSLAFLQQANLRQELSAAKGQPDQETTAIDRNATDIVTKLTQLQPGQRYLYLDNGSQALLKESPFMNTLSSKLGSELLGRPVTVDLAGMRKQGTEHIQQALSMLKPATEAITDLDTLVSQHITQLFERPSSALKWLSPTIHKKIAKSLKEDLRELATGPRSPQNKQRLAEKIWDAMHPPESEKPENATLSQESEGIEKALTDYIMEAIDGIQTSITNNTDTIVDGVVDQLPDIVIQALSAAGYDIPRNLSLWIEIEKESSGLFTLRLFCNDTTDSCQSLFQIEEQVGHRLPLVFSHIPASKLNQELFVHLLSHQAHTIWNRPTPYPMKSLINPIITALEGHLEDPSPTTLHPTSLHLTNSLTDWLTLYIRHHTQLTPKEATKLFRYNIPLDLLIHIWPKIDAQPQILKTMPLLHNQLHTLIEQLATEGLHCYERSQITIEELKALRDTLNEAQATLTQSKETKKRLLPKSKVLPPALQQFLGDTLNANGITPFHIQSLKESFLDILGDEFAETFDKVIEKEIAPLLTSTSNKQAIDNAHESTKSWWELLGFESISSYVSDVYNMRKSLLNILKAYVRGSTVINSLLGISIQSQLFTIALQVCFPQLAVYSWFRPKYIAMALTLLGPGILYKMVPKEWLKAFTDIFHIIQSINQYISNRIWECLLKTTLKYALGADGIATINQMARNFQQQLTRQGTLSFEDLETPTPKDEQIAAPSSDFLVLMPNRPHTPPTEEVAIEPITPPIKPPAPRPCAKIPAPPPCEFSIFTMPKIDAENIVATLTEWNKNYAESAQWMPNKLYLHTQIRTLPIPGQPDGEFWSQLPPPVALQTLELLHKLVNRLHKGYLFHSLFSHNEQTASTYALYAIIDCIARHIYSSQLEKSNLDHAKAPRLADRKSTHIPNIDRLTIDQPRELSQGSKSIFQADWSITSDWQGMANGRVLAEWMATPHNKIVSRQTYRKLCETAKYFKLEPWKPYTAAELDAYEKQCLFNRSSGRIETECVISPVSTFKYNIKINPNPNDYEFSYYYQLLNNPIIQKRLQIHGIATNAPIKTKIAKLFEDPSLDELIEAQPTLANQRSELADKLKDSEYDTRCGILPRPFHILRHIDIIAQHTTRSSDFINPQLTLSQFSAATGAANRVGIFFKTLVETLVGETIGIKSTIPLIENTNTFDIQSSLDEGRSWGHPTPILMKHRLEARRSGSGHGKEYFGYVPKPQPPPPQSSAFRHYTYPIRPILEPEKRTQAAIMSDGNIFMPSCFPCWTDEQHRLLEMMFRDPSDQLVRCLAFFSHSPDLLIMLDYKTSSFWTLFDTMVNNIETLRQQIAEQPTITQDIGKYFSNFLPYFLYHKISLYDQSPLATCIFLAKIGQEIAKQCQLLHPPSAADFPDFEKFILDDLVSRLHLLLQVRPDKDKYSIKSLLKFAYRCVIVNYIDVHPSALPDAKRKELMHLMALVLFASYGPDADKLHAVSIDPDGNPRIFLDNDPHSESDLGIQSHAMIALWEHEIVTAITTNATFRNAVCDNLAFNESFDPQAEPGSWEGKYPHYQKGRISVSLLPYSKTTISVSCTGPHIHPISSLVGFDPGPVTPQETGTYCFPESAITVVANETNYTVYRDIEGIRFSLLKQSEYAISIPGIWKQKAWIEVTQEDSTSTDRILLIYEGVQQVGCYSLKLHPDDPDRYIVTHRIQKPSIITDTFNLSDCKHSLSPLFWFSQDIQVKVTQDMTTGKKSTTIHFPKTTLAFEIGDYAGTKSATEISGMAPGYFIAPNQDRDGLGVPNHLLLMNADGKYKVVLRGFSLPVLLAHLLVKQVGKLQSSPLLDSYTTSYINATMDEKNSEPLFICDLTKENRLQSPDPLLHSYLLFWFLSQGNSKKMRHHLAQLQKFSRCYPLPEAALKVLSTMAIPLLAVQSAETSKLFLQLAVMEAKNSLLQRHESKPQLEIQDIAIMLATQMEYANYLASVAKGKYPYLTPFEELTLFQSLEKNNLELLNLIISKKLSNSTCMQLLASIKRTIANYVMLFPSLKERLQCLREQRGDSTGLLSHAERVVIQTLFNTSPTTQPSPTIPNPTSILSSISLPSTSSFTDVSSQCIQLLHHLTTLTEHPLSPFKTTQAGFIFDQWQPSDIKTVCLQLSTLTPEQIEPQFSSYYRLALNQMPKEWQSQPALEQLFATQVAAFKRLLPFLNTICITHGSKTKSNAPTHLLIVVLETLVSLPTQLHSLFPPANDLDAAINTLQEYLERIKQHGKIPTIDKSHDYRYSLALLMDQIRSRITQYASIKLIGTTAQKALLGSAANSLTHSLPKLLLPILSGGTIGTLLYVTNAITGVINPLATHHKRITQENSRAKKAWVDYIQTARIDTKSPLPQETIEALQQHDAEIDMVMQTLRETYFDTDSIPSKPHYDTGPFIPKPDDPESLKQLFANLTESVQKYRARPAPKDKIYRLKADSQKRFQQELTQLRVCVDGSLHEQEQRIEAYMNYPYAQQRVQETEADITTHFLHTNDTHTPTRLTFDEINALFLANKDDEILKRTAMPPTCLIAMKRHLYLYHNTVARYHILFNAIDELRPNTPWDSLGKTLDRVRLYTFDNTTPEHTLKANLLFESGEATLLWRSQLDSSKDVAAAKEKRIAKKLAIDAKDPLDPKTDLSAATVDCTVIEGVPGVGKTFCLASKMGYEAADGNNIVIFICPSQHEKTNINNISAQILKLFQQPANTMRISRSIEWTPQSAQALQYLLEEARLTHQQISMTLEQLQALQLSFIEYVLDIDNLLSQKNPHDWKAIITGLGNSLALIRYYGKAFIDEFHEASNPNTILQDSIGLPKNIPFPIREIISDTIFFLMDTAEFQPILRIKAIGDTPKKAIAIDPKVFEQQIAPTLARKISYHDKLEIQDKDREAFIDYVAGQTTEIPTFLQTSTKGAEIDMVRGVITKLLPGVLQCIVHVDFDSERELDSKGKQKHGAYARPAQANNSILDAIFESPYFSQVASGINASFDRLNEEQLSEFVQFLESRARSQCSPGANMNATPAAQFFAKQCPGYTLFFSEKDTQAVYKLLNESDEAICAYLTYFISRDITYYPLNISAKPITAFSMLAECVGLTGTPYNPGTYPTDTDVLYVPGTDGETIDIMEEPLKNHVDILKDTTSEKTLDTLIDYFAQDPDVRVLIDRGAVLNKISNHTIALRLQAHIIKAKRQEKLKGVVYYEGSEQMILATEAIKAVPSRDSDISTADCLFYCPQAQAYGANALTADGAKGIVTIDDTQLYKLMQAVWRMRGLKLRDQKIIFVIPEHLLIKMFGNKIPKIRDIITHAAYSQDRVVKQDNLTSDQDKLHDLPQRAILDKALAALYEHQDADTSIATIRGFSAFFTGKTVIDPTILFRVIDELVPPDVLFNSLRAATYGLLTHCNSQQTIFSDVELQIIAKKMTKIGHGNYEKLVQRHQQKALNQAAHVSQHTREQTQLTTEQEVDIKTQEHQHQALQTHVTAPQPPTFWSWPTTLQIEAVSNWLQITPIDGKQHISSINALTDKMLSMGSSLLSLYPPPIFLLQEVLASLDDEPSAHIAAKVSSAILVTNNVCSMIGGTSPPFGPTQIPFLELLIIYQPSHTENKIRLLLLAQDEAQHWRKLLQRDRKTTAGLLSHTETVKIALYDIHTEMIVAESSNPFEPGEYNTATFKRLIAQIKFIGGSCNFPGDLKEALYAWLPCPLDHSITFSANIREHHAVQDYEYSDLQKIILRKQASQQIIMRL